MVKAKTKALNILLPEDLAIWLDGYATEKTKTKIICELLEGLRKNGANPVGNPDVDNSVDGIESIVKAYLDKHLQSYIDNYLHDTKQADVVNPVDSDKDVYVDTDVVNPVDSNVDTDVDNPVDDSDVLPIIDAIENIAAPTIENPLPDETLSDAIAATKAKPKSKPKTATKAKPKAKKQPIKAVDDRRFTAMAAAAYWTNKTGKPLKETTLVANSKIYGFAVLERGTSLYAIIDESLK